MENWVEVFSDTQLIHVELAAELLNSEGIEAIVLNQIDSSLLAFGEAYVKVAPENQQAALEILRKHKWIE
jgi:hypothetical protein